MPKIKEKERRKGVVKEYNYQIRIKIKVNDKESGKGI